MLENYIRGTSKWVTNIPLKLKEEKTEFTLFGTQQQPQKVSYITINVGTCQIKPVKSVRNLGYFMECYIKITTKSIGNVHSSMVGVLRKIHQTRSHPDDDMAKMIAQTLEHSRNDYATLF